MLGHYQWTAVVVVVERGHTFVGTSYCEGLPVLSHQVVPHTGQIGELQLPRQSCPTCEDRVQSGFADKHYLPQLKVVISECALTVFLHTAAKYAHGWREFGIPVWCVSVLKHGTLEGICVYVTSGSCVIHKETLHCLYTNFGPTVAVWEGYGG